MSAPPAKISNTDNGMTGKPEDGMYRYVADATTQKAIDEIDNIQFDLDRINAKASEEILKVEQELNRTRKPLFDKRAEIIDNIPDFWLSTFIHHPVFEGFLHDQDTEVLQYLTKLDVEEFDGDKSGYKISFLFENNPFFEETSLTKEFRLNDMGEPVSKSTPITWKSGKDLTKRVATPSKEGKKRPYEEPESFFCFFNDDMDSGAVELSEVIKDDIWPNPLQYYLLGEADDEDLEEEIDELGDKEEEEEDDDEEEPEDEEVDGGEVGEEEGGV